MLITSRTNETLREVLFSVPRNHTVNFVAPKAPDVKPKIRVPLAVIDGDEEKIQVVDDGGLHIGLSGTTKKLTFCCAADMPMTNPARIC